MPLSRVDLQNGLHLQSWKPFKNVSCLRECPPGYEEVPTENEYGKVFTCRECSGKINFYAIKIFKLISVFNFK